MKKIFAIILLTTTVCGFIMAEKPSRVPAIKDPIARVLPNGDTLMVYLRGDEHKHWTMTLDGWQVSEKKNGYIYYSRMKKGEAVAGCKKAHNEADRKRCETKWLNKHGVKGTL